VQLGTSRDPDIASREGENSRKRSTPTESSGDDGAEILCMVGISGLGEKTMSDLPIPAYVSRIK
jgi:hypothetical protein